MILCSRCTSGEQTPPRLATWAPSTQPRAFRAPRVTSACVPGLRQPTPTDGLDPVVYNLCALWFGPRCLHKPLPDSFSSGARVSSRAGCCHRQISMPQWRSSHRHEEVRDHSGAANLAPSESLSYRTAPVIADSFCAASTPIWFAPHFPSVPMKEPADVLHRRAGSSTDPTWSSLLNPRSTQPRSWDEVDA
jgi:hypothetical protein